VRHRHRMRRVLIVAATASSAGLACIGLGSAGLVGIAQAAGSASLSGRPAVSLASPSGDAITLITGQQAVLASGPAGAQVASLRAGPPGQPMPTQVIGTGAQTLLLPTEAAPYLGNGLSADLFNVTDLRQAETNGRLDVRIAFAGALPALPGIRVIARSAGSAIGYLTPASARRFGAAMARLVRADRRDDSYGADGLFSDGLTIGLAGPTGTAGAAVTVRTAGSPRPAVWSSRDPGPDFPMRTLTFKATDRFGQPDTGDQVTVVSAGNELDFNTTTFFYKGVAKLSVPIGHYWAIAQFTDFFDLKHPVPDWRFVVDPQFTVGGSGATIKLAENSADSEITMRTPRRSVPATTTLAIWRSGRSGSATFNSFTGGGLHLWTNTTTIKPTIGKMNVLVAQELLSPRGARGTKYEYDVGSVASTGLIPAQHYTIRASSLATVDARYVQDVPSNGAYWIAPVFGARPELLLGLDNSLKLPAKRIEYFSAGRSVLWWSGVSQVYGPSIGGQVDTPRAFTAAEHLTVNWNDYPLAPQANAVPTTAPGAPPVEPSATRAGNTLSFDLFPFDDSQPGHSGAGFQAASYQVDDNGQKVAAAKFGLNDSFSGIQANARLTGRPSLVTLTLNASRNLGQFPLSDSEHVSWTWRSARQPRVRLPRGWSCFVSPFLAGAAGGRHCAAQPLMMLGYGVAGLGLDGRSAAGPQRISLHVYGLPLTRPAAVTGAIVSFSVNGGRTWRSAQVTRIGPATFKARFTASAGSYVTLRVRASDAAGGSVAETITRAYQIGVAK
jgi:hypothetical protein